MKARTKILSNAKLLAGGFCFVLSSSVYASAYCMGAGITAESAAMKLSDGARLVDLIDKPQGSTLSEDMKSRNRLVVLLANEIQKSGRTPQEVGSIVRGVCEGNLQGQ